MAIATTISSHRGGAQLWPENSREAFARSMALPVDSIEFDIHRSRDGVLMVHHDPVLGRTAEGRGAIADLDWSALSKVVLKRTAGETIPTFSEVLDILTTRPMGLRIELKTKADGSTYPGVEAEVLAVLEERGLMPRVTFTSFNLEDPAAPCRSPPGHPTDPSREVGELRGVGRAPVRVLPNHFRRRRQRNGAPGGEVPRRRRCVLRHQRHPAGCLRCA